MHVEDQLSILLLIFLYTLQAIPMGLCASIPLILKEKGSTYESLSLFSLVSLPFSLKILWAPIVDTYYLKYFGRRKSWIIPIQIIAGMVMLHGAGYIQNWLVLPNENILNLTIFFSSLYFLMATQDIAVDGWALTMLSKDFVGWASICNSLGQTFGIFIANQVFLALSDPKWCSTYLGRTTPVIDLPNFMFMWGIFFIVITIFLYLFKKEKEEKEHLENARSEVIHAYYDIWHLFQVPSVSKLMIVLVTCKFSYSPLDNALIFKFQVRGFLFFYLSFNFVIFYFSLSIFYY
jgi:PAT family acetyl-CoA transporter-like MFS transporter 1